MNCDDASDSRTEMIDSRTVDLIVQLMHAPWKEIDPQAEHILRSNL